MNSRICKFFLEIRFVVLLFFFNSAVLPASSLFFQRSSSRHAEPSYRPLVSSGFLCFLRQRISCSLFRRPQPHVYLRKGTLCGFVLLLYTDSQPHHWFDSENRLDQKRSVFGFPGPLRCLYSLIIFICSKAHLLHFCLVTRSGIECANCGLPNALTAEPPATSYLFAFQMIGHL